MPFDFAQDLRDGGGRTPRCNILILCFVSGFSNGKISVTVSEFFYNDDGSFLDPIHRFLNNLGKVIGWAFDEALHLSDGSRYALTLEAIQQHEHPHTYQQEIAFPDPLTSWASMG